MSLWIQASSAGAEVAVRVSSDSDHVELRVDDQGHGVPPDARIFDDFFTTRTHGAGIGLAVVRRIVEDHAPMGVRLFVEQPSGGGASFRVTLSRDVTGLRRSVKPPPMLATTRNETQIE